MATIEDRARDVVVVGASAGGIEPLTRLVSLLPEDLPASVFVAVHASGTSVLANILARSGRLPVRVPEEGAEIEAGGIYIAPAQHQLVFSERALHLVPVTNDRRRPSSIDALFRSAAESFGDRVVAVVLSGAMDDGTAGMQAVSEAGGLRFVQDPEEALQPWMPINAIEGDQPQAVAPIDDIAHLIDRAARGGRAPEHTAPNGAGEPANGHSIHQMEKILGPPLPLTCPECGGALWQTKEGRIACHVGHDFSVEQFESLHDLTVDGALWTAVRSLEERAEIARRLGDLAVSRGHAASARRFAARVRTARAQAEQIRRAARSLAGNGASGAG